MALLTRIFPIAALIFFAFVFLSPNPYGNNPDIILDESYFLTSSLSAIQNARPPGWDFPLSGSYYGGPQVYLDTAVMVPIVAGVLAAHDFSLTDAKIWIALHTGELLHVLRLVNGIVALVVLAVFVWYFRKRSIPRELAETLALYGLLIVSNVLVIQFFHTAKVWALHIVLCAAMGALFIAQEYYRSRLSAGFLSNRAYVALFLWCGALVASQTYVGALSVAYLLFSALVLRHITMREVWAYVMKYWYLFVALALAQASFVYQAFRISDTLKNATTRTLDGSIDWFARLVKPLIYSLEAQPLILLNVLALLAIALFAYRNRSFLAGARIYLALACAYPIFTYLVFHVVIGFDIVPRYAILMTLALSFSATVLVSFAGSLLKRSAIALAALLALAVGLHTITLYWHPSAETQLVRTIESAYNTPEHVFITDHAARRLTLPVNAASLELLNEERAGMSRFQFLLQNRDRLPADIFAPLTAIAYVDEEMARYLERFEDPRYSVWVVSADCSRRCFPSETTAGTCFEINTRICGANPHEPNTLPVFFSADQLGYSYIVRKVH